MSLETARVSREMHHSILPVTHSKSLSLLCYYSTAIIG